MSGGAWKVAYADFVTAMMALFMVLWISAQDEKILIATSRYFQNPFHSPMNATSGVLPFNNNKTSQSEGKESGSEKEQDRNKQIQLTFLNSVAADFHRLLHLDENFKDKPIDIQVTTDGLRVTLFNRANRPLFVDDTTEFTEWGRFILQSLAWTIDRHRFHVTIDGHTRRGLELRADYGGWELSADRANAARRSLVHYAVDSKLIERVSGLADSKPLAGEKPEAEANQRITISLTLGGKSKLKDAALVESSPPGSPSPPNAAPPTKPVASPEPPKPRPTP
ncbi:MAG: OmpA family protein [Verrucomicrobia bacterium]|nr:OmpA family protein [Verrucomicrobiota bacterium]